MKRLIPFLLLVFTFSIFCLALNAEGYKIKVKINGLANKQVILGHYLSKTMYPDDTLTLDNKGFGTFMGNKKLPAGMYLVYLPNSSYFDVAMGDDQEFSIVADTVDFLNTLSFEGSQENHIFIEFQRFFSGLRKKADSLTSQIKLTSDQAQKEKLTAELKKVNDQRVTKIESIKAENSDLFVSDFLRATLDVIVPDPPRDAKGAIIDSNWQYYYY
ncbi:MAG TPA: DUF4369 domain-containing protein, partial [Bacteroidales bacterium]|nr:DUF4369 domain-containing protein [Bacteroidales bacterium]